MVGAFTVGRMISHEANCILGAWGVVFARIDAMVVDACPIAGAFEVRVAFDAFASFEWAALVSGLASARGSMVVAKAFGVHGAWVRKCARIHAFVVVARLIVRAFVIRQTCQFEATELWVARVARLAHANWMMVLHMAIGIDATVAWTRTQLIHTRFRQGALGV